MKKISIKLAFSLIPDLALAGKARKILGKMKNNKYFPDPSPKLIDIEQQATAYEAALAALDGSKLNARIRDKARTDLETMLRLLGLYVLQHGDDDEAILKTSGFELVKGGKHADFKGKITVFSVKGSAGNGSMELSCNHVTDAKAYMFQYTLAPLTSLSQWTVETDTKSSHVFEGLEPGEQYCFRMAAIGKDSRLRFTNLVSRFIH